MPSAQADAQVPSNGQITLLLIPGKKEDHSPLSSFSYDNGDGCHVVNQSTSESLYRIQTNNCSRKWSDLRLLTFALSKIRYRWLVDVTFGASWEAWEQKDIYARACLPTLGQAPYIERGPNRNDKEKVAQDAFLRRVKSAQKTFSYIYGWTDGGKYLIEVNGSEEFYISTIASKEKPQATGRFLTSDTNIESPTYGALASFTFPGTSIFWHEDKPTEFLDEAMLDITLVFWKRLLKDFQCQSVSTPYRHYQRKVEAAYAATHPIPEGINSNSLDGSRLLGAGGGYSAPQKPFGFSVTDPGGFGHGAGHGGGHGGADGGGGAC